MVVLIGDCKKGDTIFFQRPGERRRIGTILSVMKKKDLLYVSYRDLDPRDIPGLPKLRTCYGKIRPEYVIGFHISGTPL